MTWIMDLRGRFSVAKQETVPFLMNFSGIRSVLRGSRHRRLGICSSLNAASSWPDHAELPFSAHHTPQLLSSSAAFNVVVLVLPLPDKVVALVQPLPDTKVTP